MTRFTRLTVLAILMCAATFPALAADTVQTTTGTTATTPGYTTTQVQQTQQTQLNAISKTAALNTSVPAPAPVKQKVPPPPATSPKAPPTGQWPLPPLPALDDFDGDGIPDRTEGRLEPDEAPDRVTDTDGDGTNDFMDPDSDNDGESDKDERLGANDLNRNGIIDYAELPDKDKDGTPDVYDDIDNVIPPPPVKQRGPIAIDGDGSV